MSTYSQIPPEMRSLVDGDAKANGSAPVPHEFSEIKRDKYAAGMKMKAKSGVNMREQPLKRSGNVMTSLNAGDVVTSTGNKNRGWLEVVHEFYGIGWVSIDFLEPVE